MFQGVVYRACVLDISLQSRSSGCNRMRYDAIRLSIAARVLVGVDPGPEQGFPRLGILISPRLDLFFTTAGKSGGRIFRPGPRIKSRHGPGRPAPPRQGRRPAGLGDPDFPLWLDFMITLAKRLSQPAAREKS